MTSYILITEPARGTTVRVDITDPNDPGADLIRWLGEDSAEVKQWRDQIDGGEEDFYEYYTEVYAPEDNYTVQMIDESRHVAAAPAPAPVAPAPATDDTLDTLTAEYTVWLAANRMPQMSADELYLEVHGTATAAQRQWLTSFILRWEAMEKNERDFTAWQATRVAVPKFADSDFSHALDGLSDSEVADEPGGYGYEYGCWIIDWGQSGRGVRYWCPADRGDLASDDLATVERFLWDNHAKHEA